MGGRGRNMDEKLQAHQVDIDPDFEPQSWPRSCTWLLPHPDFAGEENDGAAGAVAAGGGGRGSPGCERAPAVETKGAENGGAAAEQGKAAALPPGNEEPQGEAAHATAPGRMDAAAASAAEKGKGGERRGQIQQGVPGGAECAGGTRAGGVPMTADQNKEAKKHG